MQIRADGAAAGPRRDPIEGFIVFGQVVGIHIDERYIRNGLLDTAAMKPIARGGYHDYSVLDKSFTMRRPTSLRARRSPRPRPVR